VGSFANTRLLALFVVGAVLGAAQVARAQAPGGPSAEVPSIAPSASHVPSRTATDTASTVELTAQPQLPSPVPAREEHSGWSPTVFWIAASATMITASLGGFQALRVKDLYDRANGIPVVSPERNAIHDQMRSAEVAADALLIGSLALAVGTTILALQIDWSGQDGAETPFASAPPPVAARRWW
jgi:hypothetical protein